MFEITKVSEAINSKIRQSRGKIVVKNVQTTKN